VKKERKKQSVFFFSFEELLFTSIPLFGKDQPTDGFLNLCAWLSKNK